MSTLNELRNFAETSQWQVSQFGQNSQTYPRTTYVDNSWNTRQYHINHSTSTCSNTGKKDSKKKKEDQTANLVAGFLFLTAGLIGLTFNVGSLQSRAQALSDTDQMGRAIEKRGFSEHPLLTETAMDCFQNLVAAKKRVDERRLNAIYRPLYPLGGFVLGGAALAFGAYRDIPEAITAGKGTLIGSAILGVGLMAWHISQEFSFQTDCQKVKFHSKEFLQQTETTVIERSLNAIQRAWQQISS